MTPESVLLYEFSCYYLADELPLFIGNKGLDERADESAENLVEALGDDVTQAATLLCEMVSERAHPLLERIENRTQYAWTGTEEDWALFQHLARRIVDGINERVMAQSRPRARAPWASDDG